MYSMTRRCLALCLFTLASVAVQAASTSEVSAPEIKVLFEAKDPRAPAAIANLLKAEPDNVEARVLAIRQLLRERKYEAAVDSAEDLVDAADGSALAHLWLGNAYGSRIGEVGMFSKIALAGKLRGQFEKAIQLDPDLLEARSNLVGFYLQAPAMVGGGIDKAKAQVAEIAKRDPARGHFVQAQVLAAEKKLDEAFKAYEAAYQLRPDVADYRMALGLAYQQAKRWEQAFAVFERWTSEEPSAAGAWYQLGRTSALSGQKTDQGVAALRRYLDFPADGALPEAQHAWYRMGQVLVAAGDKTGARQAFQTSLKLDPKMSDAKAELAKL